MWALLRAHSTANTRKKVAVALEQNPSLRTHTIHVGTYHTHVHTYLEEPDSFVSLLLLLASVDADSVHALEQQVLVNVVHILGAIEKRVHWCRHA